MGGIITISSISLYPINYVWVSWRRGFIPRDNNITISNISLYPISLYPISTVVHNKYEQLIIIKNIKLQPVPPSMRSEALSVILSGVNSASNDIDGGTGCNYIFFFR